MGLVSISTSECGMHVSLSELCSQSQLKNQRGACENCLPEAALGRKHSKARSVQGKAVEGSREIQKFDILWRRGHRQVRRQDCCRDHDTYLWLVCPSIGPREWFPEKLHWWAQRRSRSFKEKRRCKGGKLYEHVRARSCTALWELPNDTQQHVQ